MATREDARLHAGSATVAGSATRNEGRHHLPTTLAALSPTRFALPLAGASLPLPLLLGLPLGASTRPLLRHRPYPSISTQLRSRASPASADFSGWNCVAQSGPSSTAATTGVP